jgi:hypothetical protein
VSILIKPLVSSQAPGIPSISSESASSVSDRGEIVNNGTSGHLACYDNTHASFGQVSACPPPHPPPIAQSPSIPHHLVNDCTVYLWHPDPPPPVPSRPLPLPPTAPSLRRQPGVASGR